MIMQCERRVTWTILKSERMAGDGVQWLRHRALIRRKQSRHHWTLLRQIRCHSRDGSMALSADDDSSDQVNAALSNLTIVRNIWSVFACLRMWTWAAMDKKDYRASALAEFLHSFPHVDLTFQTVNSTFNLASRPYKEVSLYSQLCQNALTV